MLRSLVKLPRMGLVSAIVLLLSFWLSGCASKDPPGPREAASQENLKRIGSAFHNYSNIHNGELPDYIVNEGKPLLSWRVRLLPQLGEEALYKEFKLDEAWDSPHNLPLVKRIPEVFVSPRSPVKEMGLTVYLGFSGPDALFGRGGKTPKTLFSIVRDGTSNTILAVEASDPVPWTKPEDIPFDKTIRVPDFGRAYEGKPLALLVDGSVFILDLKTISNSSLAAGINPDDGRTLWDH